MQDFDFKEFFLKFRYQIGLFFAGIILLVSGLSFFSGIFKGTKVEILGDKIASASAEPITVEIAGEVERPGVYQLSLGSRVENLLIISGGFSQNADRSWTDKYLNRAAKLIDGQKIFIPDSHSGVLGAKTDGGDQTVSSTFSSDSSNKININTASLSELDSLPGIGQVYAQNIIEQRPYSDPSELVSKGAIKQSLYDKIKNLVTVY